MAKRAAKYQSTEPTGLQAIKAMNASYQKLSAIYQTIEGFENEEVNVFGLDSDDAVSLTNDIKALEEKIENLMSGLQRKAAFMAFKQNLS